MAEPLLRKRGHSQQPTKEVRTRDGLRIRVLGLQGWCGRIASPAHCRGPPGWGRGRRAAGLPWVTGAARPQTGVRPSERLRCRELLHASWRSRPPRRFGLNPRPSDPLVMPLLCNPNRFAQDPWAFSAEVLPVLTGGKKAAESRQNEPRSPPGQRHGGAERAQPGGPGGTGEALDTPARFHPASRGVVTKRHHIASCTKDDPSSLAERCRITRRQSKAHESPIPKRLLVRSPMKITETSRPQREEITCYEYESKNRRSESTEASNCTVMYESDTLCDARLAAS